MDQELKDKLEQYYDKFGDVFPMMEYNMEPKDAKTFIDKCLKLNKKATEIEPLHKDVMY